MIESISANFITGASVALATTRPVGGEEEEKSLRVDNQRDDREDRDLRVEKENEKNDGPTGRNVDTYA